MSSARHATLAALLFTLPLAACTRTLELVDLKTGFVLTGTHSPWNRSMSVELPAGETARGTYTKLTTAEIVPESLFFGATAGELLGRHAIGQIYGYARLIGERGAIVEIIFTSDWLGHGTGVARTSFKEKYRVTF